MDMSKLPRLSRSEPPPGEAGADGTATPPEGPGGRYPDYYADPGDGFGALAGVEIWFMAILGIVLMFFFREWAAYHIDQMMHRPYHTGVLWSSGPKDGLEVDYPDLLGMAWLSDSATFLFGLALFLDALVRLVAVFAGRLRRVLFVPMFIVTAAIVLWNLYAIPTLWKAGVIPLFPFLAVAFLGYAAFQQWRLAFPPPAPLPAEPRLPRPIDTAPQVDLTKALLGKVLGGEPKVRCTHYKFAHQALRQAAMENPAKCVGLLQSPVAQRFLNDLWEAVRTGCTQAAADPDQPPEPGSQGLEADMTQVGPYSAVIVTLPKPRVPTEAFFVGMVLRSYVRAEDGLTVDRHPVLLYFTLEHGGLGEDGSPKTILCEWQAGTHLAYGDGPPADSSAFRDAIREKVDLLQKKEDEAGSKTSFA
jgi:hypothetical protein